MTRERDVPLDLWQPIYDTIGIKAGIFPKEINFFTQPKGQMANLVSPDGIIRKKTKSCVHTNLETANAFNLHMIRFTRYSFQFSKININKDIITKIMEDSYISFKIVDITIFTLPLVYFIEDLNLPSQLGWLHETKIPVTISPFESFYAKLETANDIEIDKPINLRFQLLSFIRKPG